MKCVVYTYTTEGRAINYVSFSFQHTFEVVVAKDKIKIDKERREDKAKDNTSGVFVSSDATAPVLESRRQVSILLIKYALNKYSRMTFTVTE